MQTTENELMGTEKLSKLMLKMAIPSILAQIINILYNIVDRIYIGRIPDVGINALTGVGVTFPILTFISAFSAFVGAGGAPLSAIWLGKGDRDKAEKIMGNGVFLLIVFSVLCMAAFYIFMRPVLYAFGASDSTYGYASSYLSIYLVGTLLVQLVLGLNPYIITQGRSTHAMVSIVVGAVTNIVLDPIFIFVFKMGVRGAAVATVISQLFSAVWTGYVLCDKKSTLKIKLKFLKPDFKIIGHICALGVSPFIMRSTESLVGIVLNRGLQLYGGDLHVATVTVMQSIMQLIFAPISGFTQGVQPIISYNYGAGKFHRVKRTYRSMIGICFAFSLVATLLTIFLPRFFASMFTTDITLIELVGRQMPVFMFGMLFFGLQMGIQPTFLGLGEAKLSLFIALLRKVLLLVPLAIILPKFFGVWGIYYAEPISDILSATIATLLFIFNIRRILTTENLEKIK